MKIDLSNVLHLVGQWRGFGKAEYPTIQPTGYREELTFSYNHKDPVLHYVQETWKISETGDDLGPLFWESGFLVDRGGGIFELISAQKSGRVEVLRGSAVQDDRNCISLELMSVSILNDERMQSSRRQFHVFSGDLDYALDMSTRNHPQLQRHLTAKLKKFSL